MFVFDGTPPKLKAETRKARQEIRTSAEKKFKEAKEKGLEADARKFAMQSSRLTGEMIEEAKKLVSYMGLPVVQAPSEGEAQVAAMVAAGDLYGCVSQDFDAPSFWNPSSFSKHYCKWKEKSSRPRFLL